MYCFSVIKYTKKKETLRLWSSEYSNIATILQTPSSHKFKAYIDII